MFFEVYCSQIFKILTKETRIISGLLIVFILIYVCGFLFPDHWWSTHFIAFISPIMQIPILIAVVWFLFKLYQTSNKNIVSIKPSLQFNSKTIGITSIVFMLLTLVFAMVKDFYGDAYKFNTYLNVVPSIIPEETHKKFFTLSMAPYAGEGTILAVITYITYYFQITYKTTFLIFGAIFGGLFVFTWLHFIKEYIKTKSWRLVLALTGLTAPFLLVFFGHIEIYAPIIFMHLSWLFYAFRYIKHEKRNILWLLVFLLLINLKLHTVSILLIPALGILIWKHFKDNYPGWKQVCLFIITPIFLAGGFIYFFVFNDHIDDRSLQKTAMAFDHIFLPLFSPEPPLDTYNLLSFNHFFDFFSLLFIWSPIALFLLLYFTISKRKAINWNAPEVIISGLSLLLYTVFFFAVNPLLSMPIDWDLFSIPAPLFLIFVATLVMQLEKETTYNSILYASKILALLCLPVFIAHQSERSLSKRLESVAIHVYSTYYEWSAKILNNAYSLADEYNVNRSSRGDDFLEKLRPEAQEGIDYEYSALLLDQGRYYMRVRKQPEKAIALLNSAQKYAPSNNAKLLSLEAHFMLNDYKQAFEVSKELVQIQFPNPKKALKIFIHCSLEAEEYNEAYAACNAFLKNWPGDKTIKEVSYRLSTNDRIGELKFLFNNVNRQ